MSETNSSRCFAPHAPLEGPPLIQNGKLNLQTHDIGWIIASVFTIIATGVSIWLICKHLSWYTKKRQQRYIVRILMMVPIYAIVSLASYVWWNHSIPITLVRDSYESFVLYSFFYLLLQYVSPTVEGQKEVFRHVVLDKWMFPLGFVKYRPSDGLFFLQLMKWGVLQYSIVRPTTTLAAVFLDGVGLYCEGSWSPGWGYLYITVIVSVSVSIAMYCLIQLYLPISSRLKPYQPLLKLLSIKAVVFLTFWQATLLSVLALFKVVKDTPYMTAEDVNSGIAALLETFEMVLFAFLHIRAFSYRPYRPENWTPRDQTPRLRSLAHAMDVREMFREFWHGCIYMARKMRGIEPDKEARKRIQFSEVMGRERQLTAMNIHYEVEEIEEWLEEPRNKNKHERTKLWISESANHFGGNFEDEVRNELKNRDLDIWKEDDDHIGQGHTRRKRSWWRAVYDRVSQGGADKDEEESVLRRHASRNYRRNRGHRAMPSLDSPPPLPSITFQYSQLPDSKATVRPYPPRQKSKRTSLFTSPPRYDDMPKKLKHHSSSRPSKHQGEGPSISNTNVPLSSIRDYGIEPAVPHVEPAGTNADFLKPPSGFNRSDSFLRRAFASSPISSENGTAFTPSHGTHTTEPMYPRSVISPFIREYQSIRNVSAPAEAARASSKRHMSSPPLQSSWHYRPHLSRTNIVLPAPLSPPRHPYHNDSQKSGNYSHSKTSCPIQNVPDSSFRHQEANPRPNRASAIPLVRPTVLPPIQIIQDIRSPDLPSSISPSFNNDRYPAFMTTTAASSIQSLDRGGDRIKEP